MSVDISILSNVQSAVMAMENISDKVMVDSTRTAITRTLTSGRKEVAKTLRARLNLRSKQIKSKTAITKPRGGSLNSLSGVLSFNDEPLPILQFVKGGKHIIKQKGVKVKKRRKLKVEITKGKKFIMKGAFIQKKKSKQVFKSGDSGGFYKQSAPSIAEFANRRKFRNPVIKKMREQFDKVLKNQFEWRAGKEADKLRTAKMRLPK